MIALLDNPALLLLALAAAIFGAGRLARVVTYDDFPPAIRARIWWDKVTKDGGWAKLAHCFWCATPWIMAVCLVWAWFTLDTAWGWTWWVFWGWLGISYIASIVVARDEPQ